MTLYGIGLGPGEPELVTVRGKRLLEEASVVYAPGELAERLARPYAAAIEELEFPMTEDETTLKAAWDEAAATVGPVARDEDVAFVTVGDPKVYSTFSHLERALDAYPEVDIRTIPGVSVVTAFATALDVEIDNSPLDVREAADGVPQHRPPQVLLLKVTDVRKTDAALHDAGYEVTYGRRLFMDDPTVTSDPDTVAESDYFTIAYAEQVGRGGES
ncbi:MAG: cobalt-factor II C(20)-methyltransferase [Halodesulfurarchaeum sp.]|nr:cobalt-factor II C(20)-methyltransferase [Halodesulfurarchaeum sp.]